MFRSRPRGFPPWLPLPIQPELRAAGCVVDKGDSLSEEEEEDEEEEEEEDEEEEDVPGAAALVPVILAMFDPAARRLMLRCILTIMCEDGSAFVLFFPLKGF